MALAVKRFLLDPVYGSNCYAVRAADGADSVAIIDPGGDPAPLLGRLQAEGIKIGGILVTHADVDHIGGVAELAAATEAEVWIPAGEAHFLRDGVTRGNLAVTAHAPEHEVVAGDTITVAGIDFDVVGIAGHSVDHVAFCAQGLIFSGDLLFAGSVGRTDLAGGDWPTLVASIRRLSERYGPDAVVYPGHGDPTTLGRELAANPFLGELREGM